MAAPRLVLTRPAGEAGAWHQALQALGVQVRVLPLIAIGPAPDAAALAQARAGLAGCQAAMFVSAQAVRAFTPGLAWPPGVRAWATGPGTSRALREAGVPADLVDAPGPQAAQFDSEALWVLVGAAVGPGWRVLVVRGADASGAVAGRDWLARQLADAGAQVDQVAAYSRTVPAWDDAERSQALAAAADGSAWLFSSSEAIANLRRLLPGQDWSASLAVATHPRIAEAARAAGFGVVREARPTAEAVAATLESPR